MSNSSPTLGPFHFITGHTVLTILRLRPSHDSTDYMLGPRELLFQRSFAREATCFLGEFVHPLSSLEQIPVRTEQVPVEHRSMAEDPSQPGPSHCRCLPQLGPAGLRSPQLISHGFGRRMLCITQLKLHQGTRETPANDSILSPFMFKAREWG